MSGSNVPHEKRLRLRRIYEKDLPLLYSWHTDPDVMALYDGIHFPDDTEEIFCEQYWMWLENDAKLGLGGAVLMELPETSEPIGECSWTLVDRTGPDSPGIYQFGGLIGPSHLRRHGYGTEALRLLCDHLFRRKDAHRLEVITRAFNTAAMKTLIQNGFEREGVLRDSVLVNGVWQDRVLFSLLRKDWEKQAKSET